MHYSSELMENSFPCKCTPSQTDLWHIHMTLNMLKCYPQFLSFFSKKNVITVFLKCIMHIMQHNFDSNMLSHNDVNYII